MPSRRRLERIRQEGVTDRELQKAINQVRADLTISYGSVSGVAKRHRRPGDDTRLSGIRSSPRQDPAGDGWPMSSGWPRPTSVPTAGRSGGSCPRAGRQPRSLQASGRGSVHRSPEPAVRLESEIGASRQDAGPAAASAGRVVRHVLANGLTLIAAENRVAQSVAIKGYVLAGPVQDPPRKSGLATLTADLVTRGTPTHSAADLADRVDFLGATTSIRAERETVGITAQMLTEHFDAVLDDLADCLRNPTFPADEVRKAHGQLTARLRREAEDPKSRAQPGTLCQAVSAGPPVASEPRRQPRRR